MTKLTFLGTGTSQGVPIIACQCPVCQSADERDKRLRASAFVEMDGLNILVDAGPDFRSQMLRADIRHLDAILLTHNHKDHTGGLDDVRSFNYIDKKAAEIYCEEKVLKTLRNDYAYAFAEHKYPGAPEWHVHLIDERKPSDNAVVEAPREHPNVVPIRGFHDQMPVLGFRFGNIAYITDMSRLPESEFAKLQGLEHLTLNTVSYHPHHSHFSLDEALELSARIGARHTWLTHLSHAFPRYEEFCRQLPEGVLPAYDGLTIHD